jgi:hypothetical protein
MIDNEPSQLTATVDGVTYHHTTESLAAFIKEANAKKEAYEYANTLVNSQKQRILDICGNVHEIFSSHYESGDSTITISVDDVNELLEYIGADTLKKLWSATVFITLSINGIEASSKEEAEEIIDNNIEVNFTDDGDANVDEIDVRDISEE